MKINPHSVLFDSLFISKRFGKKEKHWSDAMKVCASTTILLCLVFHQIPPVSKVYNLALKGNGKRHSDWFDLCSGQNTPMTNSESKYHLFELCAALGI